MAVNPPSPDVTLQSLQVYLSLRPRHHHRNLCQRCGHSVGRDHLTVDVKKKKKVVKKKADLYSRLRFLLFSSRQTKPKQQRFQDSSAFYCGRTSFSYNPPSPSSLLWEKLNGLPDKARKTRPPAPRPPVVQTSDGSNTDSKFLGITSSIPARRAVNIIAAPPKTRLLVTSKTNSLLLLSVTRLFSPRGVRGTSEICSSARREGKGHRGGWAR